MIDRRSLLLRGSAATAGGWLGLHGVSAGAQVSEDPDIDLLVAMNDKEVRKKVGDIFMQCMRASVRVRDPFFPNAHDPEYDPVTSIRGNNTADVVALALVTWSLAHVSSNGFSATVSEKDARGDVALYLSPDEPHIHWFSDPTYKHFFPALCRASNGASFGSLANKPNIGQRYCKRVASDSFYAKTIARLGVDPAGFGQYVHLLIYMADVLAADKAMSQAVHARWGDIIRENRVRKTPWTTYEYMVAGLFNEQTFMAEVQAACARKEMIQYDESTDACGAPKCFMTRGKTLYGYGLAVGKWMERERNMDRGHLLTGTAPDNKHWESGRPPP